MEFLEFLVCWRDVDMSIDGGVSYAVPCFTFTSARHQKQSNHE